MTDRTPIQIASAWFRHVADRNVDAVMALAAGDVEVGGARGSGTGTDLLREWVARTKAVLAPRRWFARDDIVIVEYEAAWFNRAGQDMGRRVMINTFRIDDAQIGGIYRHDDLAAALTIAGLDGGDEVEAPADLANIR